MRILFILYLIGWSIQPSFGQKKKIDSLVYDKWAYLSSSVTLSNDGKYAVFSIKEGEYNKFFIQSVYGHWELDLCGVDPKFTPDSKYLIFLTKMDSLAIVSLDHKKIEYLANVSGFKLPKDGTGELLVYKKQNRVGILYNRNLRTNEEKEYLNVKDHWLSESGKILVLHKEIDLGNEIVQTLDWVDLYNRKTINIWKGKRAENLILDFEHLQLAFKSGESILYYKIGMKMPVSLRDSIYAGIDSEFIVDDLESFSKDGNRLCLNLLQRTKEKAILPKKSVEIWSYTDTKLQSQQLSDLVKKNIFKASIRLDDKKCFVLQKYKDELLNSSITNNVLLTTYTANGGYWFDWSWNSASKWMFDLVNSENGNRKRLDFLSNNAIDKWRVNLSPEGKYILYFDTLEQNYFSYNISSNKINNLTSDIRTSWHTMTGVIRANDYGPRGIAGWMKNDEAVLVYDSHDIWKLDPLGKRPPINLTNGYGLKHNIVFDLELIGDSKKTILGNERILLDAFNLDNKENGFFAKRINGKGDPEMLTMGPNIYNLKSPNVPDGDFSFTPIKARFSNIFIVRRMNSHDAPNYFRTSDFKNYARLTDIQPAKNYNWYSTELLSWRSFNGEKVQGVLYKPENFDPEKQYPVIFYFYERLSDGLNAYLNPDFSQGGINIPTFVSNGYLVFCVDIHCKLGDPMQGTYDCVVSAAKYISKFPFVNSKKFGIQGHSFGGGQVNYLVANSNIFAAACSSSGIADWISGFGTLVDHGTRNKSYDFETGQYQMGSNLWASLSGYIKNSPILQANRVVTPLLIKHGENDNTCPLINSMEFFLGLRRLGKKVWMLVYPEAGHNLHGNDAKDFDLRITQFFNYYLKDGPAPVWMLDGVSASRRGIDTGLELDTTGRTPGPSLLTPRELSKADSLMTRKPITITLK